MRKYFFITLFILFLFLTNSFAQEEFEECTVGVASGEATVDGRPLLWKNRDTDVLDNEINYFTDGRFNYLALAGTSTCYPGKRINSLLRSASTRPGIKQVPWQH